MRRAAQNPQAAPTTVEWWGNPYPSPFRDMSAAESDLQDYLDRYGQQLAARIQAAEESETRRRIRERLAQQQRYEAYPATQWMPMPAGAAYRITTGNVGGAFSYGG